MKTTTVQVVPPSCQTPALQPVTLVTRPTTSTAHDRRVMVMARASTLLQSLVNVDPETLEHRIIGNYDIIRTTHSCESLTSQHNRSIAGMKRHIHRARFAVTTSSRPSTTRNLCSSCESSKTSLSSQTLVSARNCFSRQRTDDSSTTTMSPTRARLA